MPLPFLHRTLRTNALEDIIDPCEPESVGQRHDGYGNALEAERAVAVLAIEVGVLVLYRAVAVVGAHGVLERTCTVVDGVYETVKQEEGQRARDGGLVYRGQQPLKRGQRDRLVAPYHR